MSTNNSKYPQKPGFKVPENYFEELEEKLMQGFAEENSIELPSVKSGFKVPEGYFEKLEDQILEKQKSTGKVISIFRKEYLYYAAAVAAIFILVWIAPFNKTATEDPLGWDDVEVSAMEDYIVESYDLDYMDSAEFSSLFLDDEKLVDDSDFENVDSNVVIDYLEENVDDPLDIIE